MRNTRNSYNRGGKEIISRVSLYHHSGYRILFARNSVG